MNLILLPGLDGTGRLFEPLLRVLPSSLSPIVVTYPTTNGCEYAELLPFVEAAIPVGADFIVLAESFSGPLALLFAARHPPGLRGIVLSASFARSPLPAFARWVRTLIFPLWIRAAPKRLVHWALLGRYHTGPLGELFEAATGAVRAPVLAGRARAVLAVDVTRELQSCRVPLLYFSATDDRLISPRSLAYIRQLYPAVESITLAGPHLLLQVAAKAAAEAIQQFAVACESSNQALEG